MSYETDDMIFDETFYCAVIDALLQKHFSIGINDTDLEALAYSNILHGFRPFEVVNDHAESCDLVRTDIEGFYGVYTYVPLTVAEELAVQDCLSSLPA